MIVPSYVQADNWAEIHLCWDDLPNTWCDQFVLADAVNLRPAVAPDIEPSEQRAYCRGCAGYDSSLNVT